MKQKFIALMVVMLSCMATFSQSLADGFYRVQNNASKRYIYIRDCTGDVSTLGADMGAIELWSGLDNALCDPSSVMYIKKAGSAWDITSQGTGVYELTGYNMTIQLTADQKYYQVYQSGQYLYEIGNDGDLGILGAKTASEMSGKGAYRLWNIFAIDANTDSYFGFKPTVVANGKYYASFYADFSFSALNNNIKAWYVSKVDKTNAIAVIKEISGTIDASQPVFIECAGANASDNKVNLTINAGNKASENLLKGVYFANGDRSGKKHTGDPAFVEFDPSTMRVLGTDAEGNLAFVNASSNLSYIEVKKTKWEYAYCIPHNTSYLSVDTDCPATLKVMTEAEYEEYTKPTYILGDVNGDGKVSITDAPCAIRFVVKGNTTGLNAEAADMNGDGKVTITDVPILINKIVNKK